MFRHTNIKTLLLALVLILIFSSSCHVAVADWSSVIATSSTTGKVAIAGDIIEFPITVKRGYNSSEKSWCALSVSSVPENWSAGFYENNDQITHLNFPENENEKRDIVLRVKSSNSASNGMYSIWMNFMPDEGGVTVQEFTVKIDNNADINMNMHSNIPGLATSPTEPVEFVVTIENNYDHRMIVDLEVTEKPDGWDVQLFEKENNKYRITKLSLEKNSLQDFIVRVNPPINTEDGVFSVMITASPENSHQNVCQILELSVNGDLEKNEALTITPTKKNLVLNPGSETDIFITIRNSGTQPLTDVELRLQDVSGISTDIRTFGAIEELEPGDSKEIPVHISVRADASSGSKEILMRAISDTVHSEDGVITVMVEKSESSGLVGIGLMIFSFFILGIIIYKFGRR